MNKVKKAFTLVEILVVIAVMAILLVGVSAISMGGGAYSTSAAQQTMISAFTEAKNLASSKHTRTRVLIYKGDDDERTLRQIAVLYEEVDEDGVSSGWISTNTFMLPKGAFFVPPASDFQSLCKLNAEGYTNFDVVKSTFGTSGVVNIVGISSLSTSAQSMSEGSGNYYSYEFSPEGLSENAGAVVALAAGSLGANDKLLIRDPNEQMGFVVRRFGNCVGFSGYDQMRDSLLK